MPTRIAAADRRTLLVQAALRVVARHGVAAATTRAIVAEADMSLASFHYAFRSHAEMMSELVAWVVEAETSAVFATIQEGDDPRSAIERGLRSYLDYVIADPAHEQVLQELVQYAIRTPGLEHLARAQYERYHSSVAQLLSSVPVRWGIPVPDLARLLVTVTDGITLAWLADRDTAAAHRVIELAAASFSSLAAQPIGSST